MIGYNPAVISSGLIFYVDAQNPRSTSDSSFWTDISGYNSKLNKNGSPTLTTLGGASCYRFTATGQSFTGTLNGPQPTTDCTIETWIYPEAEVSAGDRGTLLLLSGSNGIYMSWNKGNLKQSNYWYGHPTEGYWEQAPAVSRNAWSSFTAVWQNNTSSIHQWTNGVKYTGSSTVGNAGTGTSINIGQESTDRQFSGGIAFMRVYNRALSDKEVLQNYNALRGRFGI